MTEALLASNLLLWLLVVVLAVVVLALARQVGVLHERLGPVGALATRRGPLVGERAPELALLDLSGNVVRLGGADPQGRRTLVFFLSPSCPVCKSLLPVVQRVARDESPPARVLLASDGDEQEHREFVRRQGLRESDYVLSTELGLRFEVSRLPYAVLIDADGVVRAKGLVNNREHLESLFEAQDRGVASVQEYAERRERA